MSEALERRTVWIRRRLAFFTALVGMLVLSGGFVGAEEATRAPELSSRAASLILEAIHEGQARSPSTTSKAEVSDPIPEDLAEEDDPDSALQEDPEDPKELRPEAERESREERRARRRQRKEAEEEARFQEVQEQYSSWLEQGHQALREGDLEASALPYRKLAELGDVRGFRGLAEVARVAQDPESFFHWMAKAAGRGDPLACLALAKAYASGFSGTPSLELARQYWERAHQLGSRRGTLFFAESLAEGRGGEADPTRALELLEDLDSLDPEVAYVQARVRQALGVDFESLGPLFDRARRAGIPGASLGLGKVRMASGRAPEALPLFREEAERLGGPKKIRGQAWFLLGRALELGHGAPKDQDQAIQCYQKGQHLGDPEAALYWASLAELHRLELPRGVSLEGLYRLAARAELPRAQFNLGRLLLTQDDPLKKRQARAWLQRSAAQGQTEAALVLGQIYEGGRGVESNPEIALEWYRQAAKSGLTEAQVRLGALLAQDPKTLAEAHVWWKKAASEGDWRARRFLYQNPLSEGESP